MTFTAEIKDSLEREYTICSKTVNFYRKQIKAFEKKYMIDTRAFLKKFEAGSLGDEQDFFDWYAFHKLLISWTKTKDALHNFLICKKTYLQV
ncbi:MAG: hypothetical protein HY754_10885 [Nitrospirae bacterium]|nr:hypothetical protein [Nitrospirota bacterium]